MDKISRTQAIKLIWGAAKGQGWDNDTLHAMLKDWGFNPPRLSHMGGPELSKVLRSFNIHRFVEDPPKIRRIIAVSKRLGLSREVQALVRNNGQETIYKLTNKQLDGVMGMLNNYQKRC